MYNKLAIGLVALATTCALGAEDYAPGKNPIIDGKDTCRVAAAAAQAFLAYTDELWAFINTPPRDAEHATLLAEERARRYEKLLEIQGALEITSSICLGLTIDPSRLSPEQARMLNEPKVES